MIQYFFDWINIIKEIYENTTNNNRYYNATLDSL